MSKVAALITPSVIQWAREKEGFTLAEAASKIHRSIEEIKQWENGILLPTVAQARKASEVYKRSLAVFYLPEPPTDFDTLRDFRRLPENENRDITHKLIEVIRTAYYHQEWAREFAIKHREDPLDFVGSIGINDDPADIANQIYISFEVDPADQQRCRNRSEALKYWITKLEYQGIYVFKHGGINLKECRGFSISDNFAPFIYLNSEDAYAGQLFTLIHELGHILLNLSGISNNEYFGDYLIHNSNEIEIFCNKIAASVLLNEGLFHTQLGKYSKYSIRNKIAGLSGNFKVSEESVARKLLDKGVITDSTYKELREEYQQRWIDQKRKENLYRIQKKSGPTYYVTKISHNGLSFTRTVISGYFSGNIPAKEASALLEIKLNNISTLANKVGM
jgi:Zn-dependent peptidase ImmA (M78 family)